MLGHGHLSGGYVKTQGESGTASPGVVKTNLDPIWVGKTQVSLSSVSGAAALWESAVGLVGSQLSPCGLAGEVLCGSG